MFNAKSYNLGPSGTLVELHIPPPSTTSPSSLATPVVILDQSGSMGQWATRCPPIISDALIQAGFTPDQQVEFITFASRSAQSTTTAWDLRNKGVESRGGTYMTGAIKRLRQIIGTSSKPLQLIVISDGELHDLPQALVAADDLRVECQGRTGAIDASLVRLMTSSYANPDTRAISCLGQLSATQVDVLDLVGYRYSGDGTVLSDMAQQIKETLRGCNKTKVEFNMPVLSTACFIGNGDPVATVAFNEGRHYIIVPHGEDASTLKVKCEGQEYAVEKHSGCFGEEDIMGFLKFLEGKMRMLAVVETDSSHQSLKQISEWLSGVESVLASMSEDDKEEKKEEDPTDYTLAARKKLVLAKVLKSQKGIINSLKHLANIDAVAGLNSQQKANFLRDVSTNKSGRGLARRAAKSMTESTPDELVADGVRKLASAEIPDEEDIATKSFYSHATAPECLELAAELTDLMEEGVCAAEILQLIGLPGIPFVAHSGNYVDPWMFRVSQVFTGDSCVLSQSDLWHSMNAGGGIGALRPPGFDTAITGVDPVRSPNPETYDSYIRHAAGINKLHASVSMRGLIAPVPDDEHAIKTAVTLFLIQTCANSGGSQSVLEKLGWEMQDMTELRINKTIQGHMMAKEPGSYFTGDLGIGNVMRLYSALLGWKDIGSKISSQQKQRILRDMYSLAVYHKLKHVDNRDEAIQRLLGIDVEGNGTHLSPVNEPNVEDPVHCSDFRMDKAVTQSFNVLSPIEGAIVMRARELADIGDSMAKLAEGVNIKEAYGIEEDEELWTVAIMVQALKCRKASDRVDTTEGARKMLIEHFTTSEQCHSYLSGVAHNIYQADYEKRLRQKIAVEEHIRMIKLVQDLIKSETMKEFIELMQHIPNRSHEAFGLVHDSLVNTSGPPLRFQKMWVLLLGRNMEGDPCWNEGNCLVGDLNNYCDVFRKAGKMDMWNALKDMRAKFPVHKYRDLPNRHGHSNEFPSFYFWGYQSLEKFKEGVDEGTFNAYCAEHAKKGCCGLST